MALLREPATRVAALVVAGLLGLATGANAQPGGVGDLLEPRGPVVRPNASQFAPSMAPFVTASSADVTFGMHFAIDDRAGRFWLLVAAHDGFVVRINDDVVATVRRSAARRVSRINVSQFVAEGTNLVEITVLAATSPPRTPVPQAGVTFAIEHVNPGVSTEVVADSGALATGNEAEEVVPDRSWTRVVPAPWIWQSPLAFVGQDQPSPDFSEEDLLLSHRGPQLGDIWVRHHPAPLLVDPFATGDETRAPYTTRGPHIP